MSLSLPREGSKVRQQQSASLLSSAATLSAEPTHVLLTFCIAKNNNSEASSGVLQHCRTISDIAFTLSALALSPNSPQVELRDLRVELLGWLASGLGKSSRGAMGLLAFVLGAGAACGETTRGEVLSRVAGDCACNGLCLLFVKNLSCSSCDCVGHQVWGSQVRMNQRRWSLVRAPTLFRVCGNLSAAAEITSCRAVWSFKRCVRQSLKKESWSLIWSHVLSRGVFVEMTFVFTFVLPSFQVGSRKPNLHSEKQYSKQPVIISFSLLHKLLSTSHGDNLETGLAPDTAQRRQVIGRPLCGRSLRRWCASKAVTEIQVAFPELMCLASWSRPKFLQDSWAFL